MASDQHQTWQKDLLTLPGEPTHWLTLGHMSKSQSVIRMEAVAARPYPPVSPVVESSREVVLPREKAVTEGTKDLALGCTGFQVTAWQKLGL